MLTRVVLEGPMGTRFGREWNLAVNSAGEALKLIDANRPGVFRWIKANLKTYERYRVVCQYADGRTEALDNDTVRIQCRPSLIRFVPLVTGAGGGAGQFVAGLVLIAASFVPGLNVAVASGLLGAGVAMAIGGVVQMLTPMPKTDKDEPERKDATSYYFDGPANTSMQGLPVQLIYGEVLVGSHAISAKVTVDQLM